MASTTELREQREVDSEEFARILTKQAAAHVCVALGFTATTAGALECLTDVIQRYVEDMAKRTMENTYRAGRTEANVADVLQGLQQMPIPVNWTDLRDFAFSEDGFTANGNKAGAESTSNRNTNGRSGTSSSGNNEADLADAPGGTGGVSEERPKRWDQPFHHTVPSFPMPRKRPAPWGETSRGEGTDKGRGDGRRGVRPPHIPDFMPPLPPSTGRETCSGSGRSLAEIRLERLKRQRQGETALRSLGAPVAAPAASRSVTASTEGGSSGIPKIILGKKRPPGAAAGGNGKGPSVTANGASTQGRTTASEPGDGTKPRLALKLGNALSRSRQQAAPAPAGFRAITPNAAGASARSSSSGAAGGSGAGSSSAGGGNGPGKPRILKTVLAGGPRGPFGRSSDSTREDRILEGMAPDGTGDLEGAA